MALVTSSMGAITGCASPLAQTRQKKKQLGKVSFVDKKTKGVDLDVQIPRSVITTKQTAIIQLRFSNPTSKPIELKLDRETNSPAPLLSFVESNAGRTSTGIALVPRKGYNIKRTSNSCWRPGKDGFVRQLDEEVMKISPSESVQLDYEVWEDTEKGECFPTGKYHFGKNKDNPNSWRFTIKIEKTENN
ncbi:hypothetical protein [Halorussus sp. MSC15.2]|uniref:hypothetical protein n=1 Tax=Halorussus sp. MSC15.2 TaxID=2283638 RepID=UPI0013D1D019|nr:hypothetical protein [Halorussus sp. MSC15.2]NEU58755.1 hypothetical protein [Halorussus sp. MSC15.2]